MRGRGRARCGAASSGWVVPPSASSFCWRWSSAAAGGTSGRRASQVWCGSASRRPSKARLGREVDVGPVTIERGQQSRIIINGLRIGNAPGAVHPYFATATQVIVTGGIDSFWGRKIGVDRIDIVEPHLYFEIYPAGSKLTHNFPHWSSGPPSRYEIYHLDLGKLYIARGAFELLDRRHDITATTSNITSTINVTPQEDFYAGVINSSQLALRIQDYLPVTMNMRGKFRFTPDNLELQSLALDGGRDLRIFLNGHVAPLSDAVYNLHVTSQVGLNRVRQIFRVNKVLDGMIDLDGMLRGKGGTFTLTGGWLSPRLRADVYDLAAIRGTMNITGDRTASTFSAPRMAAARSRGTTTCRGTPSRIR